MTTDKQIVLSALKKAGKAAAQSLQERAPEMDGTALIAEEDYIITFDAAVKNANMLTRKVGFACQDGGQVWQLLQPYDSDTHTGRPANMRAQWSLAHTKDPKKAKPYVEPQGISGAYKKDECCTDAGHVYQSTYDGDNVWAPTAYPAGWKDLGTIQEIQK